MTKPKDTGRKPPADTTGKPTPQKPAGGAGKMQPSTGAPLSPKKK